MSMGCADRNNKDIYVRLVFVVFLVEKFQRMDVKIQYVNQFMVTKHCR